MRPLELLVTLAASVLLGPPVPDAARTHEGEFSSARKWFHTDLTVLEGKEQALITYHGVLGPGCTAPDERGWCRSCGFGPALLRREGPTSYVYQDDEGTVRLARVKGAWQLALTDGSFSGCGVGWTHDELRPRPQPLKPCRVEASDARLRLPQRGADGSQDEIVPAGGVLPKGTPLLAGGVDEAQLNGNYVLVRSGESIGLLPHTDVRCPGQ